MVDDNSDAFSTMTVDQHTEQASVNDLNDCPVPKNKNVEELELNEIEEEKEKMQVPWTFLIMQVPWTFLII